MSSGPLLRTLLTSVETSRTAMPPMSGGAASSSAAAGSSGSSQRSQSPSSTHQRHPVVDLGELADRVGGDDRARQQRDTGVPASALQTDHSPAMNSGSPSARYMKNGVLRAFLPAGVSGLGFHS